MENTCPDVKKEEIIEITKQKRSVWDKSKHYYFNPEEINRFMAETSDTILHIKINPPDGLVYISPSCEHITGYTPEEYYAEPQLALKAVHPDDTRLLQDFLNITRSHEPVILRWIHKGGRIVWTEQTKTIIYDNNGKPVDIYFIARDITERKMAEEKLRESQEFITSLLYNAPHATVVINPDTSIRYVNPAWEKVNGWKLSEVVGLKAPYPWWPEGHQEVFYKNFKEAMKRGSGHGEVVAQKKNGQLYWISINWSSVTHDGELQYLLINSMDTTERKMAEETLQESEDKFSKAFHASPDAIAISTIEDGKFIDVNESFIRIIGYEREEIIGHSSVELNIWASAKQRDRLLKQQLNPSNIRNEQIKFRTKSGKIRTGLFSAEPIVINNTPCMISVTADITSQKEAEERLRLLSSITQQVSDSIVVADLDFTITYMNKAAQELFGYCPEEAIGKKLELFDPEPVARHMLQGISQIVSSGGVWSGIVRKKKKDGTIITCECKLSPLFDEKGRITSFIDVYHDVTEQKAIEAKFHDHKKFIESILATIPEGLLVIDKNDRILLANDAFFKIFHITKKAIGNKHLNEIVPQEKLSNFYLAALLGPKKNNPLEFRYKVKDQEKIISCDILKMEGDRILLTFTDISQEREEEEKLYLTDRLASLGEMAAGLAHELNNPLTGILTLSQLLVNSDISEDYKEDLQCVYEEAKRAANIVKNVLLFARNNSYEHGQASANEVVKDILRLREYEEKIGNIEVVTSLQENLPYIAIDKFQLQQVFLNIILNAEAAIKETNRPGILTVKTERINKHINVIFKDTGCGIKKQVLPRIFDPFYTTKDIGKGTGLGLSICYGIVVKHGGKLTVQTKVNEGSTFTVKLPIATLSKSRQKEPQNRIP